MSALVDPLSPEHLARLRELAGKATPGPWEQTQETEGSLPFVEAAGKVMASTCVDREANDAREDADAAYIAALSPDVVVALVDEIERLRAALVERAAGSLETS